MEKENEYIENQHEQKHNKIVEEMKTGKKTSKSEAVKYFCLSCVGFNKNDVNSCGGHDTCVLYPFRLGTDIHGKELVEDINKNHKRYAGG